MTLLYETRVAETVHLLPVGLKGFIFLCLRVNQELYEVGKRDVEPGIERIVHARWWIRYVAVLLQDVPAGSLVNNVVALLKLVPKGGDEPNKRVPNKQELGVMLHPRLQDNKT